MTLRVVLAGCGAAKRDEASEARDLYTSNYFALKREYAETVGDQWAVLSAEHGIVAPRETLDPYDTTASDLDGAALDDWRDDVITDLTEWLVWELEAGADEIDVTMLAGKSYLDPLRPAVDDLTSEHDDITVSYPFDSTSGIGDQMGWLSSEIEEATDGE